MKKEISFAQKGLVLDTTRKKLLVNKYLDSKYLPEMLTGKLGLPGGQLDFGEDPDISFIREVQEETGITIKPLLPFHVWTWTYQKENLEKQIVAIARLALYESGEIKPPTDERESKLEPAKWLEIATINIKNFIIDEQPVIKKFLEYSQHNPFELPHTKK